ncbi:MAG: alpha/beta fold hydrolase [Pseudomonadota bacterium]
MKQWVALAAISVVLAACGIDESARGAAKAVAEFPVPEGTWVQEAMIPSRGVSIPVTMVIPPRRAELALPLVVLIHGHGGTREEAGGFTRVAAELAARGIVSIRMDFPGCGDSTESFRQNNLTNMKADVRAAQSYVQQWVNLNPARVGVVGFSMGGRLAVELSREGERYAAMVLWAPAIDNGVDNMVKMLGGEERYREMKAKAKADGFAPFTTFWGQEQQLGTEWFADLEASRALDGIERYTGSLLLIHGLQDSVVPPVVSRRAEVAASRAARVQLLEIEFADHGFGLFDDRYVIVDELVSATVQFLADEL